VHDAKSAWRAIRSDLGLQDHVFHNTKASYVTRVAQSAAAATTQSLGRHKDYKTTGRYLRGGRPGSAQRRRCRELPRAESQRKVTERETRAATKDSQVIRENGALEEIRTPDPQIRRQVKSNKIKPV
jgi:hypothetical protein